MAGKLNKIIDNTDPRNQERDVRFGEWVKAVADEDRKRREKENEMPDDVAAGDYPGTGDF
jgi:hypothetical protein